MAGVDPLARDYLLELIRTLRSPEAPLLLSTHLINGVDYIFNEIVLISDGRLLIHDSADNLRALGDGDLELAYKRSVSGRGTQPVTINYLPSNMGAQWCP